MPGSNDPSALSAAAYPFLRRCNYFNSGDLRHLFLSEITACDTEKRWRLLLQRMVRELDILDKPAYRRYCNTWSQWRRLAFANNRDGSSASQTVKDQAGTTAALHSDQHLQARRIAQSRAFMDRLLHHMREDVMPSRHDPDKTKVTAPNTTLKTPGAVQLPQARICQSPQQARQRHTHDRRRTLTEGSENSSVNIGIMASAGSSRGSIIQRRPRVSKQATIVRFEPVSNATSVQHLDTECTARACEQLQGSKPNYHALNEASISSSSSYHSPQALSTTQKPGSAAVNSPAPHQKSMAGQDVDLGCNLEGETSRKHQKVLQNPYQHPAAWEIDAGWQQVVRDFRFDEFSFSFLSKSM